MKVLVIGGTGWVGHNIALACSRAGFDTTVMSRRADSGFAANVSFLHRITGDKSDRDFMYETLKSGNYDCVIDSVPAPQAIDILAELCMTVISSAVPWGSILRCNIFRRMKNTAGEMRNTMVFRAK